MDLDADFSLRLYVAGDTTNSRCAVANLSTLCQTYLPHRHQVEVVDVQVNPHRALRDRVFLTPSLVILAPAPVRRIIGTLSNADSVLEVLGLRPPSRSPAA